MTHNTTRFTPEPSDLAFGRRCKFLTRVLTIKFRFRFSCVLIQFSRTPTLKAINRWLHYSLTEQQRGFTFLQLLDFRPFRLVGSHLCRFSFVGEQRQQASSPVSTLSLAIDVGAILFAFIVFNRQRVTPKLTCSIEKEVVVFCSLNVSILAQDSWAAQPE